MYFLTIIAILFGSIYCIVRTTEQSIYSVHKVFVLINWKNYLNRVFQKTTLL